MKEKRIGKEKGRVKGKGNNVEKWEGGEGNQFCGNFIHSCLQMRAMPTVQYVQKIGFLRDAPS